MWIGDLSRSEIFNASFLDGFTLAGLWSGARRPGSPTRMFMASPAAEWSVDDIQNEEPAFAWLDVGSAELNALAPTGHWDFILPIPPGMVASVVWQLLHMFVSEAETASERLRVARRDHPSHRSVLTGIEADKISVVLQDKDKKVLRILSPAEVQRIMNRFVQERRQDSNLESSLRRSLVG
jgi:hypothetical protein